ncbi:MAG: prolipoprotein diacylglyceryl transferase [Deferribacteres bacterium]|nr:prolipoprotein diacylglyceryl transferase [candidate division KSB1 bacterium]MCB9502193.1 prolipoprotein diacylglyceryl transferase [Deferribacteres bacterium]
MEPTYFIWDISPEITSIGPISLRWYSLCFMLSFLIGLFIMRKIFIKEGKNLADLDPLFIHMMLGTAIGARLGHCLFYDPMYYLSNPLEIFKVWEGGLASHGGAIGILFSLWLYARKHKDQPLMWVFDRLVIPAALGGFFIRLGNFFNSEILGTPTDVPWAIIFKRFDMIPRHPTMLYESVGYLVIFVFLVQVYRHYDGKIPRGLTFGLYFLLIFGWRFYAEFYKVRQAAFGEDFFLSVGQILSIPAILMGAYFVYKAVWNPIIPAPAQTQSRSSKKRRK